VDFSKQIKDEVEGWAPEKLKVWNNTSWTHILLLAAGWGPFGEAPGTPGAWIPSAEDRKNAVTLLEKALAAVHVAAVEDGKKQLAAMGIPAEEIEERLGKATLETMLASFEAQLKDPQSPLSITVDAYARETFGFYIAAGKAIAAWKKDPERPLTDPELKAIAPEERQDGFVPVDKLNRIAAFNEDAPVEFPGGLDQAKDAAKNLEELKQAIYTTKGLSEQGIKCGMLGCEGKPTILCPHGCKNWYCAECAPLHAHVLDKDLGEKPIQMPLPREVN
jgi:hypothetical protein